MRHDRNRNQKNQNNRNQHNNSVERSDIRQVIGIHAAREVLKVRPQKISEMWLKEGAERIRDLNYFIEAAKKFRINVRMKPEGFLDKIAPSHQGICLQVTETPELDLVEVTQSENEKIILLALDEVTDPHNIGAVLRTAWLMGIKGILVPENRSGHLTPSVMKVACGGAEHVPMLVVSNLASELKHLKDKGFWIYGLAGEARNSLPQTRFNEKVVLVLGAEDKGLRSTTVNACDELISIPQNSENQAEASYNASVAAALVMYEVSRQHKTP